MCDKSSILFFISVTQKTNSTKPQKQELRIDDMMLTLIMTSEIFQDSCKTLYIANTNDRHRSNITNSLFSIAFAVIILQTALSLKTSSSLQNAKKKKKKTPRAH